MKPVSPYALSKLACLQISRYYRSVHKLDVRQAIAFNHESPFRNELFVTRKITSHIAQFGSSKVLHLGNVDAVRDWGHALDFVRAYYLIMKEKVAKTDAYVVSTGVSASVKDFCSFCYQKAGFLDIEWKDNGLYSKLGQLLVSTNNSKHTRTKDVPFLRGDSSLIEKDLGWKAKFTWQEIASEMLIAD